MHPVVLNQSWTSQSFPTTHGMIRRRYCNWTIRNQHIARSNSSQSTKARADDKLELMPTIANRSLHVFCVVFEKFSQSNVLTLFEKWLACPKWNRTATQCQQFVSNPPRAMSTSVEQVMVLRGPDFFGPLGCRLTSSTPWRNARASVCFGEHFVMRDRFSCVRAWALFRHY